MACRAPRLIAAEHRDPVEPLAVVAEALLRRRRLLLLLVLSGALLPLLLTFLKPRTYTSRSTFMAQTRQAIPGSLSTLAAQIGMNPAGLDGSYTPAFFADYALSEQVLGAIADSSFGYGEASGPNRRRLVDILGIDGQSPAVRRNRGVLWLRSNTSTQVVPKTGVVAVTVRSASAALSQALNQHILAELQHFNTTARQLHAGAERRFTESRLSEAQFELRQAEQRLQEFLSQNRDFRNSPILSFQQERLAREVALRQQLYGSLAQAYEQARIEEVRDTPALAVVEEPSLPPVADSRQVGKRAFIGGFAGLVLGVLLSLWGMLVDRLRARHQPEYERLRALASEAAADLRHPFRAKRRKKV